MIKTLLNIFFRPDPVSIYYRIQRLKNKIDDIRDDNCYIREEIDQIRAELGISKNDSKNERIRSLIEELDNNNLRIKDLRTRIRKLQRKLD